MCKSAIRGSPFNIFLAHIQSLFGQADKSALVSVAEVFFATSSDRVPPEDDLDITSTTW